MVLCVPDSEGSGFAGGEDERAVGGGGGGEDGVVDAGKVLVVCFEVPGGGSQKLVGLAEEGNGGKFGGEATLGFRFLPSFGVPEFVEAVGSGGGEGGGVGTPGEGEDVIVMAFECSLEGGRVEVMDFKGAVGGGGGQTSTIG